MASLREEVLQLTRLVNDLHTLSVADADGLRCEFTHGNAHTALLRVARRFAEPARQRGLELHLPPDDAPAIAVYWDFGRVEQLLDNLLANSLRYTDAPGEVFLTWKIDSSKPNSSLPQRLILSLEDSAPGVNPADLPQLFEPLFRADKARQRGTRYGDAHGSGLGLAIVRSIVHAHGGTVAASPSARGGLWLCVYLPLQAGLVPPVQ